MGCGSSRTKNGQNGQILHTSKASQKSKRLVMSEKEKPLQNSKPFKESVIGQDWPKMTRKTNLGHFQVNENDSHYESFFEMRKKKESILEYTPKGIDICLISDKKRLKTKKLTKRTDLLILWGILMFY
ncbi:hypothetical protein O181_106125 [Austropuccinia psidii MF-1]|uniref:Uncharacterized protein n=1 Tax=Austropuccinia psidii MF-1 TaxID=1389203 RepID=A0A9Q3JRU5_9BASI|nr:hypothetical protein [Austropuccinia psidii MF-1]